jgi:hypothetical protein
VIRRLTALVLLLVFLSSLSVGQVVTGPEPYGPDEFPGWAKSLRRAEIITIGIFPFVLFFTSFAFEGFQYFSSGGDSRYAPGPFRSPGAPPLSGGEKAAVISVSISLSMALAAVDYFIGRAQERKTSR